jgi:small conductance mechanosensitive channel
MNEFVNGVLDRLEAFFNPATLGARFAELLADTVVAIVVFVAFYVFWLLLRPVLRRLMARTNVDETGVTFLSTVIKYGVLTIGLINAMSAIGINTGSVVASLGIAGLTIGFAARDAFSNLISGLLIFLDRPFVIGDLVEIEDKYGRVDQIKLRSTRIVTRDGKMLAVPNADIINKTVASYTNFPHLRLDISVTIGVNEDVEQVRQVLLALVTHDDSFMDTPPPRVVLTQINDYNLEVALQVWLRDEREHVEERYQLREAVLNALNAAGIDMPFETLQLAPVEVKRLADLAN